MRAWGEKEAKRGSCSLANRPNEQKRAEDVDQEHRSPRRFRVLYDSLPRDSKGKGGASRTTSYLAFTQLTVDWQSHQVLERYYSVNLLKNFWCVVSRPGTRDT